MHSNAAIYGAYTFGSSLVPEAKTYRFLADALNDAAIILDTFSPLLSSHSVPGLRVSALCLSASFRALCGISAGGSKAAITLHFATPIDGTGDVGDLNAKDSSKETVLALLGMLVCLQL
jgi:Vitamin B6 photo-protection and homoeostasis